ncbi:MAG: hypothetical protein Q9195_008201 [Heterodermia aff. obscurata]
MAVMGPPPFPVDPSLDAWNNTSVIPLELDGLLYPGNGLVPLLHSPLPGASGSTTHSPELQLPSIRENRETDSVTRWNNDPTSPWTSLRNTGSTGQPIIYQPMTQRTSPGMNLPTYRDPLRSEMNSSTTGRPLDSTYGSRSFTGNSEGSLDHPNQSQGCPSVNVDLNGFHFKGTYRAGSTASQDEHFSSMDGGSSDTSQRPRPSASLTCPYDDCGHISKNNSEHNTHNDTDRHMKSVHKVAPKNGTYRSYRCAAPNCPKKEKIWPRLDNFRQHCHRLHKGEAIDELVSNYTSLAHLSLIPSRIAPSGMDRQQAMQIDQLWQGNSVFEPSTHAFDHGVREYNLATMDPEKQPASPSAATSHYDMQDSRPKQDITLLQVPTTMKRQRTADNLQDRRTPMPEKRYKASSAAPSKATTTQHASPEIPTEPHSPNAQNPLQEIRNVAKKCSGDSKVFMSSINRVLSVLGEGDQQKQPNVSNSGAAETKKFVECDRCHKRMARRCDLKKHEKRHTRPYGCTFATCSKSFGSKNDWKRHENTRHYQIETWRCNEASSRSQINQCAKVFYRREQFQAHLKESHLIKDDEVIREHCKKHRIGRNGQSGFWCGFCKKIVTLKHKGLEAWDERFNHIDQEHFKNGQTIVDHWYPLDKDIPIGSLPSAQEIDSEAHNSPADNDGSEEEIVGGDDPRDSTHAPQIIAEAVSSLGPQMTPRDSQPTSFWYCVGHMSPFVVS